jgi:prepilin-type N-terminal cleavage/methylation domain-containing protein
MMVTTFLKSQLARVWSSRRRDRNRGFTLAELLIVTIIAGGIVSGLLYLVVELLTADQRDSSRNETQRDMQRALDYISSELRQAVYVYPGECLGAAPNGTLGSPDYCPGLASAGLLPPSVANLGNGASQSVPILAFWRQKDLPPTIKTRCANASSLSDPSILNIIPCAIGNSYALVVYSVSKANSSSTWAGNARITRYELPQFEYTSGNPSSGYASPIYNNKQIFRTWPYGPNDTTGAPVDTRSPAGAALGGTLTVLTDFVDDGQGAAALNVPANANCPDDPTTIDDTTTSNFNEGIDYTISPANYTFQGSPVRSFYACVSNTPNIDNRNVILYVRGNAYGRPGINTQKDFLATLSTQVLSRGILDKDPS